MPLNLITDPWLPVRTLSGGSRVIAPWQMAEADVAAIDFPRPDLTLAAHELLIGLVLLADPPADLDDWFDRSSGNPARLREKLAPYAPAFNLTGPGPLFLQDLDAEMVGNALPAESLFIDAPGENALKNNTDIMVRRGRYDAAGLAPELAAMALYTLQAFAPSGGQGHRTSMRGGGPMVTLIEPATPGLWPMIWANTPYGTPAPMVALPWMRPTVTSEKDQTVTPLTAHPVEAFFGMPCRIRLHEQEGRITGLTRRHHGTNYAGWVHPLSPYYRQKEGSELLPCHPQGVFGYKDWLGIVILDQQDSKHQLAEIVTLMSPHERDITGNLLVAGWDMDNAKPRAFTQSRPPLLHLTLDQALLLTGLIKAADLVAKNLWGLLAPVLGGGAALNGVRGGFYAQTEGPFSQAVAKLTAVNFSPAAFARDWLAVLRREAMAIADAHLLPGFAARDITAQESIITKRSFFLAMFAGSTKDGAKLWKHVGLEPEGKKNGRR